MNNFRVVVTDDRFRGKYDIERRVLNEIGAQLEIHDLRSPEEAVRVLKNADGILVNLYPINEAVIKGLERCQVLSRYGVGYDNVDVPAATKKRIWVARVPDYGFEDVSDHALALLMACVRNLTIKDTHIRKGEWNIDGAYPNHRVKGKVMGLLGFGGIARTLRRKLTGLGLSRVIVHDPYVEEKVLRDAQVVPVNLDTLFRDSDFLSIHVALTDETRHLVNSTRLSRMKPTAILINTSRGPVVDELALAEAVSTGGLAGAGLDVFETEPLPADSLLRQFETIVLSDHSGWYTEESVVELKTKAARNVMEVLKGNKPTYPVNEL